MNVQAIGDADMLMIYQDAIQPVTTGGDHICINYRVH